MIDRSAEFNEIKKKYAGESGFGYIHDDRFQVDCAKLWGFDWPCDEVNEHGVWHDCHWQYLKLRFDRDWHIDIKGAQGKNGLWASGYNYWFSDGGGGSAPSIVDSMAFESFEDLQIYYLGYFKKRIKDRIESGFCPGAHIPLLRRALEKIQDAETPQLALF